MKIVATLLASVVAAAVTLPASAQEMPGITAKEIKIGGSWPLSGPVSSFGRSGMAQQAYMKSVNDKGGINGRMVDFLIMDDAYTPAKAVEQTRRLVEGDGVAYIAGSLGSAGNSAIAKYLVDRKIPQLFISAAASKFGDIKEFPNITTAALNAATEGKALASYVKKTNPSAKVAILYQNDDFGRDYVNAFKSIYGSDYDSKVVTASYEVSDPTLDSQIVNLKGSNADYLVLATVAKPGAQAIRKVRELGWKTQMLATQNNASIPATFEPAGLDNSAGIIATAYTKDPSDPKYANDPDVKEYLAFMAKYMPNLDPKDDIPARGYIQAHFLEDLFIRAGNDLSRENILKLSRSMPDKRYPLMLDGVTAGTSATNNQMLTKMRLQQFDGKGWTVIGDVISGD